MAAGLKLYRGFIVVFILILAASLLIWSVAILTSPPVRDRRSRLSPSSSGEEGGAPVQDEDQPPGLKINLSDGGAQPETVEPLPVKPGEPLSLEEINAILLRLPPLASDPDDRQAFKLPEEVLPPPRTGDRPSRKPLPAAPGRNRARSAGRPAGSAALQPGRRCPAGAVCQRDLQPADGAAGNAGRPVKRRVARADRASVPGTWRWLGTKTLNFQFDSELIDRMPMATEYTVTVPAGTTSANGRRAG
jgi:alpha-2-macroglobulin